MIRPSARTPKGEVHIARVPLWLRCIMTPFRRQCAPDIQTLLHGVPTCLLPSVVDLRQYLLRKAVVRLISLLEPAEPSSVIMSTRHKHGLAPLGHAGCTPAALPGATLPVSNVHFRTSNSELYQGSGLRIIGDDNLFACSYI